jgi:hypothetical protein
MIVATLKGLRSRLVVIQIHTGSDTPPRGPGSDAVKPVPIFAPRTMIMALRRDPTRVIRTFAALTVQARAAMRVSQVRLLADLWMKEVSRGPGRMSPSL